MSGMIYAVIVVMWAAFLVPMWLRRHDEFAEAKSVDKFASKMRVLARRSGDVEPSKSRPSGGSAKTDSAKAQGLTSLAIGAVSSTVRIVGRDRSTVDVSTSDRTSASSTPAPVRTGAPPKRRRPLRDAWADDADDAALAALAAPDLARDLARDRGYGRAPATLAARRRRVLVVLVGATLLLVGLSALSLAPWLLAGITGIAAVGYVIHLRIQATRSTEIARRRTRAARGRPARSVTPAGSGRFSESAVADRSLDLIVDEVDDPDGWRPVSVPVPTYVTAPRVGRAIRRIDLRSDDAWTSGRLVADAAAAGRAAAAAAHQETVAAQDAEDVQVQRAVGD